MARFESQCDERAGFSGAQKGNQSKKLTTQHRGNIGITAVVRLNLSGSTGKVWYRPCNLNRL
jgi:hypothetical protein